jgi:hypothetical protein
VGRESGTDRGAASQGKDPVLERRHRRRKGVRERKERVLAGAPGEDGQDAPGPVVLGSRLERGSVRHRYHG